MVLEGKPTEERARDGSKDLYQGRGYTSRKEQKDPPTLLCRTL